MSGSHHNNNIDRPLPCPVNTNGFLGLSLYCGGQILWMFFCLVHAEVGELHFVYGNGATLCLAIA